VYPNFDTRALQYAESTKYPFIMRGLVLALGLLLKTPEFKGPVLWVVAERDVISCGGNCVASFGRESVAVKASRKGSVEVRIV
jgi:hypothetical protein